MSICHLRMTYESLYYELSSFLFCCQLFWKKNDVMWMNAKTIYAALILWQLEKKQDMPVLNDPLGQIHNPASSDHYSLLNFVFV